MDPNYIQLYNFNISECLVLHVAICLNAGYVIIKILIQYVILLLSIKQTKSRNTKLADEEL